MLQHTFRLGPPPNEIHRRIVRDWQNALMDEGILNSTPYVKGDPLKMIKSNPSLIGRLRGLAKQSSWAAMSCKIMSTKGSELCSLIEEEISKM